MARTILLYGNCQAGALSAIFGSSSALTSEFRICYMPSFDDPSQLGTGITREDAASAAFLFEQHDPVPFPFHDVLPDDCATTTFPAIDFNLLWPLTCTNPYNDPTPELPWGHNPYGDRIIIDCIKRGLSRDATWAHYLETSETALPDLDRFAKLERSRLASRESKCDITIADYIFERFTHDNLFWCVNHPTMEPLRMMASRLVAATSGPTTTLGPFDVDAIVATMPPRGPLALVSVPVHPSIAKHFGLEWYPQSGGHYGVGNTALTYEDYFLDMIERSIAVRRAQEPAQA